MGGGGARFSGKNRYEGVRFNVISVTRGWAISRKKRYVALEWPHFGREGVTKTRVLCVLAIENVDNTRRPRNQLHFQETM